MKTLQTILERYQQGKATEAEKSFVEKYYDYFERGEDFTASLSDDERKQIEDENWARLETRVDHPEPARIIPMITRYRRWVVAAALIIVAAGTWWFAAQYAGTGLTQKVIAKVDIPPGRDGAILTLNDGSQMVLDSMKTGVIGHQSGSDIVLNDHGIEYAKTDKNIETVVYNTLSTPKGRQFHIELPDGTEVWLNAASAIRYPTSFNGRERKVFVMGEAYFEVARNKTKPFIVDVDRKASVEVLGTHFNINAYKDEPTINTTLMEGSIRLSIFDQAAEAKDGKAITLNPGQQARINGQAMNVIGDADLVMVMAWKNGVFQFNNTGIDEVLRQLARWYNLEIVYEQQVPDLEFTGVLRRDYNLSQALTILESMGVKFKVVANKLIVLP
jgi:transmembrane sensor